MSLKIEIVTLVLSCLVPFLPVPCPLLRAVSFGSPTCTQASGCLLPPACCCRRALTSHALIYSALLFLFIFFYPLSLKVSFGSYPPAPASQAAVVLFLAFFWLPWYLSLLGPDPQGLGTTPHNLVNAANSRERSSRGPLSPRKCLSLDGCILAMIFQVWFHGFKT